MKNEIVLVGAGLAVLFLISSKKTQSPAAGLSLAPLETPTAYLAPQEVQALVLSTQAQVVNDAQQSAQLYDANLLKAQNEATARAIELVNSKAALLERYANWAGVSVRALADILTGAQSIDSYPWLLNGGLQSRTAKSFSELQAAFGV